MELTPKLTARFGWFFAGHLPVSVLSLGTVILTYLGFAHKTEVFPTVMWLLLVGMLALYIPAGALVARARGWKAPDAREGLLAVVLPAAVAWVWALGGWLLMVCGRSDVGMWMLLSTAFFATPSFLLMLLVLPGAAGHYAWAPVLWYGAMFLAGLLPPLLFFWGTLLPKRRLTSGENVIE